MTSIEVWQVACPLGTRFRWTDEVLLRTFELSSSTPIRVDRRRRSIRSARGRQFYSVSHTEGLSVVALADVPVGIDVERLRSDIDVDRLARRIFSDVEMRDLNLLHPKRRTRRFLEGWVALEAHAKATGYGLLPFWASGGAKMLDPSFPQEAFERDGVVGCVAARAPDGITLRLHDPLVEALA